MKQICTKCKINKDMSMFHKRTDTKSGYRKDCKVCMHTRQVNNLDKHIKASYDARWYILNKERRIALALKYQTDNPYKACSIANKRRANKLNATPTWLEHDDFELMEGFYEVAKERTDKYGIKFEVDHIIPLQGKNVCGFHCPENLQVITAYENRRKSNKY